MPAANVTLKLSLVVFLMLTASGCESLWYGSKLHAAAAKGNNDTLANELAKHKIDVDDKNDFGKTALHLAISNGQYQTVKFLVDNGAAVNLPDSSTSPSYHSAVERKLQQQVAGAAPLHYAAKSRYTEIARYLLAKGADISGGSSYGNSPLHFAYFAENNNAMTEFLLASGADRNARNNANDSPVEAGLKYLALKKRVDEEEKERESEERREREEQEDEQRREILEEEDAY